MCDRGLLGLALIDMSTGCLNVLPPLVPSSKLLRCSTLTSIRLTRLEVLTMKLLLLTLLREVLLSRLSLMLETWVPCLRLTSLLRLLLGWQLRKDIEVLVVAILDDKTAQPRLHLSNLSSVHWEKTRSIDCCFAFQGALSVGFQSDSRKI